MVPECASAGFVAFGTAGHLGIGWGSAVRNIPVADYYHPVSRLEARDLGADSDDFAGAIRARISVPWLWSATDQGKVLFATAMISIGARITCLRYQNSLLPICVAQGAQAHRSRY